MRFTLSLLVALFLMAAAEPLVAQVPEFPTDCTEAMSAGNVFIGHDCGEWASILISGRIIIRKPWSRANRANRGVRLRLRREAGGAPPIVDDTALVTDGPATMFGVDISNGNPDDLDCPDFPYQEDAQELFDSQGWSVEFDPYGLDDGGIPNVPCESNSRRP